MRTEAGRLSGRPGQRFAALLGDKKPPLVSQVGKSEQSNTAVIYDNTFLLKLYRRLEEGVHPELEIGRFLSDRIRFEHVAPMAGSLEYRRDGAEPIALALLQGFVPNQGDAWTLTLSEIGQFLDRVLAHREEAKESNQPVAAVQPELAFGLSPALLEMVRGFYPEMIALLGKRTGEFHLALASRSDDPDFAPEPFALLYQRSVYQSMGSQAKKVLSLLRSNLNNIAQHLLPEAEALLGMETEILAVLKRFMIRKFSATKTRIHGDYHLGQLLYTGNDFLIIDFEGEPVKSLGERRIKRAAYAVLMERSRVRAEDIPYLVPWVQAWYRYNAGIFLASYQKVVADSHFMPTEQEEVDIMLHAFMLDKALYELGYELNNRPEWVSIPLRGIMELLVVDQGRSKEEAG